MELCSHLAESFYFVILFNESVKIAGFWAHGIPSLAAATSRQLTVTLLGQGDWFGGF